MLPMLLFFEIGRQSFSDESADVADDRLRIKGEFGAMPAEMTDGFEPAQ